MPETQSKPSAGAQRKTYDPSKPIHAQVDTGMGFTCDAAIVEIVRAIYCTAFDLSTDASCQEWPRHRTGARWLRPQGYISIRGRSFDDLVQFGLALQDCELDDTKFGYEIPIDAWNGIFGPRAYLHFHTDYKEQMLTAIKGLAPWEPESGNGR